MTNDDLVIRSDELDAELDAGGVGSAIDSLFRQARHTRLIMLGIIGSLIFDVALSLGFGWVAFQASQAASDAATTREVLRTSCEQRNISDAGQLKLWRYIIELSAQNPQQQPTPETDERTRQFVLFLDQLFAPHDCSAEALRGAPKT